MRAHVEVQFPTGVTIAREQWVVIQRWLGVQAHEEHGDGQALPGVHNHGCRPACAARSPVRLASPRVPVLGWTVPAVLNGPTPWSGSAQAVTTGHRSVGVPRFYQEREDN